jgi:ABC-type antimicrobial peptide transport system permease subunit
MLFLLAQYSTMPESNAGMYAVLGLLLAGIGLVIGLGAAYGLTRLLAQLLFGIKTTDPVAYTAVALTLIAVALVATIIPALRATRVDPLNALRYE